MLGRLYEGEVCSAARALEAVGERWSLLIVRNAIFAKMTRFSEFQKSLGIAPNILTKRLAEFVEEGIFELQPDETGKHTEYVLTEKGHDLKPVLLALTNWGDRWDAPEEGPPILIVHDKCGGRVALKIECTKCKKSLRSADVEKKFARWTTEKFGWINKD